MRIPLMIVATLAGLTLSALAQTTPPQQPSIFGVWVDPDGMLRHRDKDATDDLAQMRARARASANKANQPDDLKFVSLPKLFAQVKSLREAGQPIPDELAYLGGITQLRYILVFPEQKDLMVAGPAEAIDKTRELQPRGKTTGRPVLQLEDFVTLMRATGARPGERFGCSIDPPPYSVQKGQEVLNQYGNRPRPELARALSDALGPQQIRFFGTPEDTRVAFVCVATDYKLKRYSLDLEPVPVAGVGHSIDNSRVAGNGFWFEMMYEPLLVAQDGNAYELRGQRLQLKAGAVPFDEKGATEKAKDFARRFTAKMNDLARVVPLIADLQNVADLSILAALIRQDRLDQRIGWDIAWIQDPGSLPVKTIPVPRATPTLVHFTSGSLAAGGVGLSPNRFISESAREIDQKGVLASVKQKAK